MAAGPLLAGVVEQALTDVLPDRVRTVEPDGVRLLDLDGPGAAAAAHPQNMLGNFGQPQRPDRGAGRPGLASASGSSRTACQYSGGIVVAGARRRRPAALPADGAAASFSICFGVGMRQLAGRSVMPD